MPRPRTKKLSPKEMNIWISGYNKGLKAGISGMAKALKEVKKTSKVDRKDEKGLQAKLR